MPASHSTTLTGDQEGNLFVAAYGSSGKALNAFSVGGLGFDVGYAVQVDGTEITVAGTFSEDGTSTFKLLSASGSKKLGVWRIEVP